MEATTEYRSTIPWGKTLRVLTRDGYACRVCDLPVVADGDRRVVRVDWTQGDAERNLRLMCARCANAHDERQRLLEDQRGQGPWR